MDPAPIRRWNPGFIALRWRHLFWGLPSLGLLFGLFVHFLPTIRNTSIGVVEIDHYLRTEAGLPSFTCAEVPNVIRSEKVLGIAIKELNLREQWKTNREDCVANLRNQISCKLIPGTELVEISVTGRSRAESAQIWKHLASALNNHAKGVFKLRDQAKLDRLESGIEKARAEVEIKRRALPQVWRYQDLLHRKSPPVAPPEIRPYQPLSKEVVEFEESRKLLELLQIKFISEKMQIMMTDEVKNPIWIHEAPGSRFPLTLWDTLRPLVLHSSIGVGVGMVLALVLAYLLELLFPRKSPTL
jgi:hypothetical protein